MILSHIRQIRFIKSETEQCENQMLALFKQQPKLNANEEQLGNKTVHGPIKRGAKLAKKALSQ